MYMYLSDRKRRMYLSLPLPQNVSPKNLSIKDKRGLQKVIGTIPCLSVPLRQQIKLLYEKHIHPAIHTHNLSGDNAFSVFPLFLTVDRSQCGNASRVLCNFDTYFQVWHPSNSYKSIPLNLGANLYRPLPDPLKPCAARFAKQILESTVDKDLPGNKKQNIQAALPENPTTGRHYATIKLQGYSALCVFVQTIKTKKRACCATQTRQKHMDTFKKASFIRSCLHMWSLGSETQGQGVTMMAPHALDKGLFYASPPLFVNGTNKYLFCRFLYNREHILTNIKPQMLRPGFPIKAKFLHEKKKVHFFYGCYAKKDFQRLSTLAQRLPGVFEDNMYTLLESRIDVLVHRAGFTKTVAMARQLIRQGQVYVNEKPLCSYKVLGNPGDVITLQPHKEMKNLRACYIHTTNTLYKRCKVTIRGHFNSFRKNLLWKLCKQETCSLRSTSVTLTTFMPSKATQPLSPPYIFDGYLYPGFFLYKSLSNKTVNQPTSPFSFSGLSVSPEQIDSMSFFLLFKNICLCISNNKTVGSPRWLPSHSKYRPSQSQPENVRAATISQQLQQVLNIYIASILKWNLSQSQNFAHIKNQEHIFEKFWKNIQNANCASIWGQKPLHLEISQKTTTFIYLYRPQKIISPVCIDFYALKMKTK